MLFWTAPAMLAPTRAMMSRTCAAGLCALAASLGSARAQDTPASATPLAMGTADNPVAVPTAPLAGPMDAVPPPTVVEKSRNTGILPAFIYGNGVFDADKPNFVATVRGGVRFSPAYFGSTTIRPGPDAAVRLDHVELPGGVVIGSNDTVGFLRGLTPRLSARYLTRRVSNDYAEIAGLDNIPFSIEAGFGVGYERRNYRAFADARYGVIGHNSWVADIGADGITYPYEGLTLTLGPRVSFGSQRFMDTYFGISAPESEASGLASYKPESGIYGAGIEFGARYLFNERWGIEGVARWTKLVDSAANSPIVENGADDQYIVRFDFTRRISLGF
jgi:outer membrane scaffolding protein for murein synthesis (MipA/OmpV family)